MNWIKYFSFSYVVKLISLTVILNYFSIAYHGLISPEGESYSRFLDQNINYIQWTRNVLMYGSNLFTHLLGTPSYISGTQIIKVGTHIEVDIWLPCLGIGIMSFWTAFIVTNNGTLMNKLKWWIMGLFFICLINCIRIALLLVALDHGWEQSHSLDHHDLFNIAAYELIGILMYCYNDGTQEDHGDAKALPTTF